jgi:hypothetical protein
MDLHTNIHQHLWNSLVITPTTNVDAYLLCIYAGVDGIDSALKSHQHFVKRNKKTCSRKHDEKK